MASRDGIMRRNLRTGRANDTTPSPFGEIEGDISCLAKGERKKKGEGEDFPLAQSWWAGLEEGLNGKIVGNKLRFEHRLDV